MPITINKRNLFKPIISGRRQRGPGHRDTGQSLRHSTASYLPYFFSTSRTLSMGIAEHHMPVAAADRGRPQDEIVDGLLGRLDCGLEKEGQVLFAEARQRGRSRREPLWGRAARGREGDGGIAAAVRAGASCPRHAQDGPLGEPPKLSQTRGKAACLSLLARSYWWRGRPPGSQTFQTCC